MKYIFLVVIISLFFSLLCNAKEYNASEDNTESSREDYYFDIDSFATKEKRKTFEFHGLFEVTLPIKGRDDDSQQPSSKFLDENELILWFGKGISEKVFVSSEIEIKKGFQKYVLEKCALDYEIFDTWFAVRLGKFLYPLGIERMVEDGPDDKLIDRPLPSIRIIPGTYSDTGVMCYGTIPLPYTKALKYEFALTNGLEGPDPKDVQHGRDNNRSKRVGGRLEYLCMPNLKVGASYSRGNYDEDDELAIDFLGFDVQLQWGSLLVRAEYITSTVEQKEKDGGDFRRDGYYLQTSYKHVANLNYLRYLEGVIRFDSADPNKKVTDGEEADRLAIGLNYSPMEHVELKVEFEIENEPGEEIHNKSFIQTIIRW